ncbi:FGGY-family carbohydrate kinase [Pukyongiella litopenaei]|uniref:FGGY-family carbohydrate kinase n=1 Tax=Pukyongiella litopenaei TaxID=2605946 RepID=A0A2S0MP32_9RHOB|nr:FGGY-family carbohydrate kinase [Pukyongiella litopenaei]AVO37649.1 FGGY-family carbohydrate kinase [Pukyongiella litopenaei]
MTYTLGVDIGTYQTKGVLVDGGGRIVAQAARAHEMIVPCPGRAEHRAEADWWGDFVHVTRALLADSRIEARAIGAVACSAIGPCMLPVDGDGTPLMNAVLYGVDTRATAQIDALNARIGADTILERCGNALTSQAVGPKIQWLQDEHPGIFARARHILTSTSYLVMKLTGEVVIDHYTAANFAPLYDVDRLDWTDELAPDLIDRDRLPRLMWSNEIAGRITARAAAETGLAVGTPVTCGTIDAAAEAVSVGVRGNGDMMMMYGSTIFIITLTDTRLRDARLWYAPWLFAGQHASMAGLATSGTLTHWFRDTFARDLDRDTAFATLAAEAAHSPPGANGLLLLPYFSGERTPIHDPAAKGAFFGLNLTHGRGDMYRALIEGIACGTNHVIETYAEAGQRPDRVLAVGGGTQNRLWLEATGDFSGLDQIVCDKTVGASFGDAFLAACAVGTASAADIDDWNPVAERVVAAPQDIHRRHYGLFRRLYDQTSDIAAAL